MSLTVSDASLEDLACLSLSVPSMNGDDGSTDNVSEIKPQVNKADDVSEGKNKQIRHQDTGK